jgi:hypothetical protein
MASDSSDSSPVDYGYGYEEQTDYEQKSFIHARAMRRNSFGGGGYGQQNNSGQNGFVPSKTMRRNSMGSNFYGSDGGGGYGQHNNFKQNAFVPSKTMRRNSMGSNFYGSTEKAARRNSWQDNNVEEYPISFRSTDHTTPLSYRSSERSERKSYMSSEDSKPDLYISYMSSEDRRPSKERSKSKSLRSSEHSRHKSRRNSGHSASRSLSRDRSDSGYNYSKDGRKKAKRRNSCDYDYTTTRPSAGGASKSKRRNSLNDGFSEEFSMSYVSSHSDHGDSKPLSYAKAKRRNSCDYDYVSAKPSASKARRRNSCDYNPQSSTVSFDTNVKMKRRNSWHDTYTEDYSRKATVAKQKKPRRKKSLDNSKPKSERKRESSKKLKKSSSKKKDKKKSSSSKHLSTSSHNKDAQKNQPRSIRLNSQLMRKIGDFRPYFVPLKKKQEVLNSKSQHQHSQISQTFTLNEEVVSQTVNDGPAQILHEGMKNISVATFLHEGVPVVKVSHSKLGKLKRRVLTLSDDQTTLFLTHSKLAKGTRNVIPKQPAWTPSKGWNGTYIRAIDVANICDFQVGVISSRWLELSVATHLNKAKKKGGENSPDEESKSKDFLPYMPDPARVASVVTIFHIDARTGRLDSLDFFIENQDHRRAVVATLALMKYTYDEVSQLVGNEILLYRYIIKDMTLGTNDHGMTEMNESEFLTLCRRLNFTAENIGKEFREFYKQHTENAIDSSGKNKIKLPIHECLQFIQLLKGKENPSLGAWRACFGTATCVDALTVLTKFLHGPQQEQKICDVQDARDLVNVMNATELGEVLTNRKGSLLTQWQFQEFLRSEWNDIYDPEKRVIDKQRLLDKPLSHYWINSSFRTSSMSDGIASIQSYTRALLRGCKSIDLNCWDGIMLPDGECVPIIIPSNENPGTSFSMKNQLTFRSVVLVVRKYLLENRKTYPIVFNLENNCSDPFQRSMVGTMKELFGKRLFVPGNSSANKELPSPEDLRGMVVVNARKPMKRNKDGLDSYRSKSFSGDIDAYAKMFNKFSPIKPESFSLQKSLPESAARSFTTRNRVSMQIGKELMSLSLFHDVKFSGYFLESMDLTCSQMHVIKDIHVPKIGKEYSDNPDLWRKYNASHRECHVYLCA